MKNLPKLKFKMSNRSDSLDLPLDLSINKSNQQKQTLFKPYLDCNSCYKIKSEQLRSTLLSNQLVVNEFIMRNLVNCSSTASSSAYESNLHSNMISSPSNSSVSSGFTALNSPNSSNFNNNLILPPFINPNNMNGQPSPSYSPQSTLSLNSSATTSSFFSSNSMDFNYTPLESISQPIDLSTNLKPLVKQDNFKDNKEFNQLTAKFRMKPKKSRQIKQSIKKENDENQILIKCPQCWQLFDQENSLRKHIKSKHQLNESSAFDRIHKCEHCDLAFTRYDMLQRHNRRHTGSRPYECNLCYRNFTRSDHLNTHRVNHFNIKQYSCSVCSYSSNRRDMVSRHLQVHLQTTDAYVKTDLIAKQLCRKLVHTHPDQIPGLLSRFRAEC